MPSITYLHDVPARVALLRVAVRIRGAITAVADALARAFSALVVRLRADPYQIVRGEMRPFVLLEILGYCLEFLRGARGGGGILSVGIISDSAG